MQINPGAAEFPHRQIAGQLKAQVRRGDWQPGERLPSIPAIAEMFGVAKQTVQRAVDQLRVEGILITKPGSGTYVRGTRRRLNRLSRGRYGGFRGYHTDLAARYRQQLVSVGRSPAPRSRPSRTDGTDCSPRHLVRRGSHGRGRASWFLTGDTAGTSWSGPGVRPTALSGGRGGHRRHYVSATTPSARYSPAGGGEILQIRPAPVLHLLHFAYDARRSRSSVAQATWPGRSPPSKRSTRSPPPTAADPDPGLSWADPFVAPRSTPIRRRRRRTR